MDAYAFGREESNADAGFGLTFYTFIVIRFQSRGLEDRCPARFMEVILPMS